MKHPGTDPLESCVRERLEDYFSALGDAPPRDILSMVVRCVENIVVQVALEKSQNNQTKAAEILGVTRSTLRKKIQLGQRNAAAI